ncbi:MAG: helix-turn-helix domain-containing protein [Geminicoccaceae bacterium]
MPNIVVQTSSSTDRLAVSVGRATHMSGLGRTKIYEGLGAGDLCSIKIGGRRLILVDDLRDWLASHKQGSR